MSSPDRRGVATPDEVSSAGRDGDTEVVPTRHARLLQALSGLQPAQRQRFPLETILLTAGGLCIPIGMVLIIVGWYGAAHTGHLYEQIDYLISGGLLGLALIGIGCFLYFAFWLTRQIHVTETVGQQTQRALSRLETQVAAMAASTAALVAATSNGSKNGMAAGASPDDAESGGDDVSSSRAALAVGARRLVATERGRLVHRADCPIVAGKERLRSVEPDDPGYRPCGVCAPFDEM